VTSESHGKTAAPAEDAAESYDALVARLEKVVGELESGTLDLERSIEKFAEGIRLAREASSKLDAAERRVEVLLRNEAGEAEVAPFDAEGAKGPPR
jgi:exodeoxyribonuclease VII small subunit